MASETKELQPPLLRGASLWGSPGPEKAEAPRQGPASPGEAAGRERVHSGGLSLLGNPPASSARAGEGQAHRTWVWVCKGGKIGGGGNGWTASFTQPGLRCLSAGAGVSEMDVEKVQWGGLRGSWEGGEGRTPHPSPSLEIGPGREPGFLAGVVDQPCSLCTYV